MPLDPHESEPDVLASDAEREHIVAQLNDAVGQGRLTLTEYSDRSAGVYASRKRSELAQFVADLPTVAPSSASQLASTQPRNLSMSNVGSGRPTQTIPIGSVKRHGNWQVGVETDIDVFIGSIKLDLRDAQLESSRVTINARASIGSIKVVVPEGLRLVVDGITLLGSRTVAENNLPSHVNAPTVHLRLDTGIGSVKVYVHPEGKRKRRYF